MLMLASNFTSYTSFIVSLIPCCWLYLPRGPSPRLSSRQNLFRDLQTLWGATVAAENPNLISHLKEYGPGAAFAHHHAVRSVLCHYHQQQPCETWAHDGKDMGVTLGSGRAASRKGDATRRNLAFSASAIPKRALQAQGSGLPLALSFTFHAQCTPPWSLHLARVCARLRSFDIVRQKLLPFPKERGSSCMFRKL
jgi:hypothetical protein